MNWTTPANLTRNTSLRRWIISTSGLGMMFLYLFLSTWVGFIFSLIDRLQCKDPCSLSLKFSYACFNLIHISHPFLLQCLLRMRIRRKSNLVRIVLLRTKVSEAVCKFDWRNMWSYLFFNMWKFQMIIWDSVCKDLTCLSFPGLCCLILKLITRIHRCRIPKTTTLCSTRSLRIWRPLGSKTH